MCNDAWQIRNGTEREQLACASDPPYVVTFLFISRFSCVVDEDCQLWLTLKCLATLCWYRVSYQDTPKTVVVKRQIEELQRTVESLRQSRTFFYQEIWLKKKLTQLSCISVMRVVFVWVFFPFNFLSVKKQTILDSVFWLIAMTFLFKTWHNFCNNTKEKYNTLYTVHNKRCEDNSYVDHYMTNSNG